jgi:hypothetical protein
VLFHPGRRSLQGNRHGHAAELRNIRTRLEFQVQLVLTVISLIILREALSNFGHRAPDNMIGSGIIIRFATEYIYPDRPLLKLLGVPSQRLLDDIRQNRGVTFAVSKNGAAKNALQLL